MSFNSYRAYLASHNSSTPLASDRFKNDMQNVINRTFEIASNYEVINHMTRKTTEALASSPTTWSSVGVRTEKPFNIQRTSAVRDNFSKIIFKNIDYDVRTGDVFEFKNSRWIVIDISTTANTTLSALLQKSNITLRFVDKEPLNEKIIEIYAISSKYYMDGLKNAQYIKMPNNTLDVWIPNDFNSRKIQWTHRGGTRFLLGNPYQNWRAISYDSISLSRKDIDGSEFGITRLELELSDINSGIDDLNNGIAWQDYF